MAVGDKIRTAEYNTLQSKVSRILGNGGNIPDGPIGYGQRVLSSPVSTDDVVSVNDWGNLRNDIVNIWRHQNGSDPTTVQVPSAVEGASIRYNASDAPVTAWTGVVNTLEANRVNALPVGRYTTYTGQSRLEAVSFFGARIARVYYYADVNQMRLWFNNGGRVRLTVSFTPSLANSQNTAWQTLTSTVGTVEWGGYFPDVGYVPSSQVTSGACTGTYISGNQVFGGAIFDGRSYWKSDASFRTFASYNASSPYGMNTLEFAASLEMDYSRGGPPPCNFRRIGFKISLIDAYTDPPISDPDNPPPDDLVQGDLTVTAGYTVGTGPIINPISNNWIPYGPDSIEIGPFMPT